MRVVLKADGPGRSAGRGPRRSRARLWQSGGFSGKIHPARQAHRSADPGRPARQRASSARARLLGAAPPSEGRRDRAVRRRSTRRITRDLCDAAVRIAKSVNYDNAGTVRIPLRPRHARMVLHRDEPAHPGRAHRHRGHHRHRSGARANPDRRRAVRCTTRSSALPQQDQIPRIGYAVQCRITTEDPENKFTPDYGKILTYRSAGGFGIRLDGGMGDAGAVITPFYDSLLVKVTASAPTFDMACQRMDRALREIPHPRREDEHPVPGKRHPPPDVPHRPGHHDTDRHHAGTVPLLAPPGPRHQAAEVSGRRHRQRQPAGQRAARPKLTLPRHSAEWNRKQSPPPGTRDRLLRTGPGKIRAMGAQAKAPARHRHDFPRRAPIAAGHARAHLRHARRGRRHGAARAAAFLAWRCGAARRSTPPALSARGPVAAPALACANTFRTSASRCSFAAPNARRLFQLSRQRRPGFRQTLRRGGH